MRLLNVSTLELVEFPADRIPPYAILSHTWGDEEVLFNDVIHKTGNTKRAFTKLQGAAEQALSDGFAHIWVDTCCINKDSSAELSEAINSMFVWYQKADACYAYLSDVEVSAESPKTISHCRWFTRGWALQELLAPKNVVFFSRDWVRLGTKIDHCEIISRLTGIHVSYLCHTETLDHASIAQRMSWASYRNTTRPEDVAYCLMGLFSVNMPLLYGEGSRSFLRLQEEIMRQSDDESIFAWYDPREPVGFSHGLLATSPAQFAHSGSIVSYQNWERRQPYSVTNRGLRINLPLKLSKSGREIYTASLNCLFPDSYDDDTFIGIYLQKVSGDDQYTRVRGNELCQVQSDRGIQQTIYVRHYEQRSLQEYTRGLFPHHILLLRPMSNSSGYSLVETLPRREKSDRPLNPGLTSSTPVDMEPAALSNARIAARKWVPSRCRFAFAVPKRPNQLAAALLFHRDETSSYIGVMFAMTEDFGIDFHAVDVAISSSGQPDWPMTLQGLQHLYASSKSDEIFLKDARVDTLTEHIVWNGGKYYAVEVILRPRWQLPSRGPLTKG
ncbi:hypothetical protein FE257_001191 [Aspergillus nanangensis]|uniref:Heterokaryon incompatibility domain-containing protein n=1 Tax=Aspergillus nanangensis TaxID=2582783 RepID=A0AAD4GQY4_ASPNN|nr:hypothetical protein FE257_001191 [Aspergillus nanangensis]